VVLAEILVAHQERAVVRVGDAYVKVETDRGKAERVEDGFDPAESLGGLRSLVLWPDRLLEG